MHVNRDENTDNQFKNLFVFMAIPDTKCQKEKKSNIRNNGIM